MNEEQRYTLDEARVELQRQSCRGGHSWTIAEIRNNLRGVLRLSVYCDQCGWVARTELNGPDPAWPGASL